MKEIDIDYEKRRKDLQELMALPLEIKIQKTIAKILEFYQKTNGNCYLSCSGGSDSICLYHIIEQIKDISPNFDIPVVFDDTGLEEPSVRARALSIPNIKVVRPQMSFYQVLTQKGYPLISKETAECIKNARRYFDGRERERDVLRTSTNHSIENYLELENIPQRVQKILGILKQRSSPNRSMFNKEKYKCLINAPFLISNECCNIMKKGPMGELKEYPIIATMVEESKLREQAWLKSGCNSFDKKIQSKPLSFWTKQDVLEYLKLNNIKIAECYGEIIPVDKQGNPTFEDLKDRYAFSGVQRSGCIFCLFGISQDTQKGGINRFEHLRITQPKLFDYCMRGGVFNDEGIWVPHKGLGLAFVIEWLNRNLSKTLKNGKKSLYIKGLDLSDYKQQIDEAFKKLEEIEPTRKKWLKE